MAEEKDEKQSMLVKQDKYLEAGIHIGTKMRTYDMSKFVFKTRDDGLHILDLREIDSRLRRAAKMMGKYKPEDILVVASRTYSGNAASKFAALTGVNVIKGRFIPGTMTNIALKEFREPKLLVVSDPKNEQEAVTEAAKMGIPIIALCDTDNEVKNIDFLVPANNKGRKSLALIYFILTRELMMSQGKITSYDQFEYEPSYFEELEIKKEVPKIIPEPQIVEKKKEEPKKEEKAK
ncbi:30S ribosomal protein S2 [Candidatus Micrarchaeota archaeon]|nr:30S ribosomal protein S2 [Candidatus Micrarchaeota archaeon]